MKSTYSGRLMAGLLAAVMLLSAYPGVAATEADAAEPMFKKVLAVESATAGSIGSIQTADRLIDGSGMSGEGQDATHDNSEGAATMWHIKEIAADPQTDTAWVQFDMGTLQQIGKIYVWNHNQNHPTAGLLTDRGLKDIKVEYSIDGVTWFELRGAQADAEKAYPYTLAQATGSSAEPASNLVGGAPIEMNKLARYVKITADPIAGQGNYGSAAVYGMSEVRFAEMDTATADQATIYEALSAYFALYEEEYTAETWSAAEAAAANAISVFNSGSDDTAAVISALQEALAALQPSGKLHVNVVNVANITASSDAGGNSNIHNIINGSGMSDDTLQATHTAQSGGIAAWSTSQAEGEAVWVEVDFGRLKPIGSMHVWNNNHPNFVYRGMKNVKIETSVDGEAWDALRNGAQISNDGDYPYTLAQAPGSTSAATNLVGGEPVAINQMIRYLRITADPVAGQGNYWAGQSDKDYALSELRFGTPDTMTAEQVRIDAALSRLTAKNGMLYTADSWAAYLAEGYQLAALYGKSGLTAEETTAALTAFEAAEAALARVELEELVIDFDSVEGIVPTVVDAANTEMTASPEGGWLKITGEQTKDGAGRSYISIVQDLKLLIQEDSRLTYIISPKMDLIYNGEYPSQHVAVDLKFSDGTYLSDLGVLDDNGVGIHPNAQGESKTQIMCGSSANATAARFVAKNLITVCLGEWEQVRGKTVTEILVGYENENGYDNYVFETAIDEIQLKAAEKTYEKPTDYVLTTAGTINFQHNDSALGCYSFGKSAPFVALPQSFNLWAPQNVNATNQLRTIYNYEREYLKSFTCSHQANYHIGDVINWNFAVTNGGTVEDTSFDRANEIARAHYYSVEFDRDSAGRAAGTRAELTTTEHGAALRVTYDEGLAKRGLILKGINDTITGQVSSLSIDQETDSFAAEITATINHGIDKMYVFGTFDAAITAYDDTTVYFDENAVTMKVATSFISAAQAKANYEQELKDKTFMEVYTEAENAWLEKLGAIEIEGATETQMISFYTALYRSFLYPNHLGEYTGEGDADGWQYRGIYGDKGIEDGKLYYNNGFWDNYRTTWPLMALLDPDKTAEMIQGLLYHYEDNGWIPRWTSAIGVDCMCGTSSDIIFGDAIARGVELDAETLQRAYEASLKNATVIAEANAAGGRDGLDEYTFLGYITDDAAGECALSWALAGYYNDYGIAQLAKAAGDADVYEYMLNRCLNYVNMFDTAHEWFRGIEADAEAEWAEDLNPFFYDGDYMESYAWIMAFDAPYDGQGLLNLYGSREELEAKLDAVFNTYGALIWDHEENRYSGPTHEFLEVDQVKMGMYEHNNQPAHHIPYMYLYAGNPAKTQSTVRQILRQCYTNVQYGGGYIGDDDSGEQSAWYVLSALGLYPLNMGSGELVFGSPLFTKATIHLQNGKDIVINAPENSPENVYVKDVRINGVSYHKTSVLQTELTQNGAVIDFEMTHEPSDWGTAEGAAPTSVTAGSGIPNPLKDQTNATVAVTNAPIANGSKVESAYSVSAAAAGNLFDNTAETQTTLTPLGGKSSVYYHFTAARNIGMYTLTSGTDSTSNPGSYALYGSNDGESWTLLDKQDGKAFDWAAQTKPFMVENGGAYTDYRVDIYSDTPVTLAEIELLSDEAAPSAEQEGAAKEMLQTLYDSTAALDEYWYTTDSWSALETAKASAQAALEEDASADALNAAREALQTAISGLSKSINYTKSLNYMIDSSSLSTDHSEAAEVPANAMDGIVDQSSSKWCSTQNDGDHWLQIDFGKEVMIESWLVHNTGPGTAENRTDYTTTNMKLQVLRGSNWVDVDAVTDNTATVVNRALSTPAVGESFRLYVASPCCTNQYGTHILRIYEFHLFGEDYTADMRAADAVETQIAAIETAEEGSRDAAIAEARNAYDALTAAQKGYVANYATLLNAELADSAAADQAAAAGADAGINAIGEVTLESKAAIEEARAAYNALTEDQKGFVTGLERLKAAEQQYEWLIGAESVTERIAAIDPFLNRASGAVIAAARAAYDALDAQARALVTNRETLEKLEAEYNAKAAYTAGDLNGSGEADLPDVILLLQQLVGYDVTFRTFADINNDGRASIFDAVILLKQISQ